MDSLWIEGGRRLSGEVQVPGSKNASLPLLCLSLLTSKKVELKGLPVVSDIRSLIELLENLGVYQISDTEFQCAELKSTTAPYELVRRMRASVLVLGPLVARAGKAKVSLPGGCAIGERPIDIHLKGLKALGATIDLEEGYVLASAKRLVGNRLDLEFPTVTGTINLMMAAALAKGETVIQNAAREPEVSAIAQTLVKMGCEISGIGESSLHIQGVDELKGFSETVPADRIQFLTYLAAGVITGGALTCSPYRKGELDAVLEKFREMGCEVTESDTSVKIKSEFPLKPVDIETAPFPGFPTDAQAQLMACLCFADSEAGRSHIKERIFENRFQHVSELRRMGADIKVSENEASVRGVSKLSGTSVMASDLRASASLVLAGLAAEGQTQVLRVYHLDRGYEGLEERLTSLGAKVWRAPQ